MNIFYYYYKKKKSKQREIARQEFDSSSVGDLAFLLLIFFIVTSSFILRQGIFLSLPSKKAGSVKIDENQMINIYPTNSGFIVDGGDISRNDLIKKLKEKKKINREVIVVINMPAEVKYNRLVDALSVSKESGITRVSLKNITGGAE